MLDARVAQEIKEIAHEAVSDSFANCMETKSPDPSVKADLKIARTTCNAAAKVQLKEFTANTESADPVKTQKDIVRAAKRGVAEVIEACIDSGDTTVKCGDPDKPRADETPQAGDGQGPDGHRSTQDCQGIGCQGRVRFHENVSRGRQLK